MKVPVRAPSTLCFSLVNSDTMPTISIYNDELTYTRSTSFFHLVFPKSP